MSQFPGSPRLLKASLVTLKPDDFSVAKVIVLQYNPDQVSRTLQLQGVTAEGDRLEALRIKGPPIETYKIEAEIDATDQLEVNDKSTIKYGLQPQLSALELLLYPTSKDLATADSYAGAGMLEIFPATAPPLLLAWNAKRVVPVRLTEFSINEEAFDPNLNPIRAKVSLGMRVLSINDLDYRSKLGSFYLLYQKQKESLAQTSHNANLSAFGL